jgi:hypothetical protein
MEDWLVIQQCTAMSLELENNKQTYARRATLVGQISKQNGHLHAALFSFQVLHNTIDVKVEMISNWLVSSILKFWQWKVECRWPLQLWRVTRDASHQLRLDPHPIPKLILNYFIGWNGEKKNVYGYVILFIIQCQWHGANLTRTMDKK